MTIRDFLSEHFAATFAGELMMRLAESKHVAHRIVDASGNTGTAWWVIGVLPLKMHGENGATTSAITIRVRTNWLQQPPIVTSHAPFIRREADWHTYPDSSLCYVLDVEWRERLARLMSNNGEDISRTIDYAITWLLAATDSLVTRHLLGARYGFNKWPEEWIDYAHGEDGVREYQRRLRARIHHD